MPIYLEFAPEDIIGLPDAKEESGDDS